MWESTRRNILITRKKTDKIEIKKITIAFQFLEIKIFSKARNKKRVSEARNAREETVSMEFDDRKYTVGKNVLYNNDCT